MPLTMENARRLLEQDHDVTEVTQGGNAMGHYLEARLTDGRAVQIDFHDNPAWKDTDRLAGRIEVSYANRRAASTRPAQPGRAIWPRTSRRRNTPTGGGSPGTPTGTSHT